MKLNSTRFNISVLAFALLLLVSFSSGAIAQQKSESSKSFDAAKTKKAAKVLKELGRDYGVEVVWDRNLKLSWPSPHRILRKGEEKKFSRYAEMLNEEFRKYPKVYIKKTKLKQIFIGVGFKIGGQRRQAVPDYFKEILVLDFTTGSENYRRHVIHHEFYHMVEQEFNGSPYFKDPRWASFNKKDFKYGAGGHTVRKGNQYAMVHPKPGFVNRYSTSGLEEDKAEIYAILFESDNWKIVSKWIGKDPILAQKIEYMKDFLKKKDPSINDEFWKKVHKKK